MLQLKSDIYWVGAIDWNLRNFHGYSTPFGSSYNAYLILDEKKVLIDTVKDQNFDEMLAKISSLCDPKNLDYIVCLHAEQDHSGGIFKMAQLAPQAKVIVNAKGKEHLEKQFHKTANWQIVQEKEVLKLGKYNLEFYVAPMVHWPDNMLAYLPEEKIIFSNDAFGQHYASSERFVDQVGSDLIMNEAAKYYANIVLPYPTPVSNLLKKLSGKEIKLIAPSHGLMWQQEDDIKKIVSKYQAWSQQQTEKKVIVVYDTMWHSTELIAKTFAQVLDKEQIPVGLFDLKISHYSDIMTNLLESRVMLLGSSVINMQIMPTVGQFLTYLKGLKPAQRFVQTFGSYGWSGGVLKILEDEVKLAKMELLGEGMYHQFAPTTDWLNSMSQELVLRLKKVLN